MQVGFIFALISTKDKTAWSHVKMCTYVWFQLPPKCFFLWWSVKNAWGVLFDLFFGLSVGTPEE